MEGMVDCVKVEKEVPDALKLLDPRYSPELQVKRLHRLCILTSMRLCSQVFRDGGGDEGWGEAA